jgi:hypothetical protein
MKTETVLVDIIEQKVCRKQMGYMDAVLEYCREQDEDIEDVAKKLNKAIRDHIELEAQDLHFLPKNGVLPL